MMWPRSTDQKVQSLQAELSKAKRIIAVLEAERDAMAGVIARDRMRVAAETAIHARTKAESEGNADEQRNQTGNLRIG